MPRGRCTLTGDVGRLAVNALVRGRVRVLGTHTLITAG
jgi:hypothetical protein